MRRYKTIACAGGKGGVGKTLTACALARAISKRAPVTVLDLDLHGPNVLTQFGLPARYAEVAEGKVKPVWYEPNLAVYSADMQGDTGGRGFLADDAMKKEWVLDAFESIDFGPSKYVVCDLPAGTDEIFYQVVRNAPIDAFVVVTNPDGPALQDAHKMLTTMMDYKLRRRIAGVIENKAWFQCRACGHEERISDGADVRGRLCEAFGVPYLGGIPYVWGAPGGAVLDSAPVARVAEGLVATRFKPRRARRLLGGG